MKKLLEFAKLIGINSVLELESFKDGPAQTVYMPVPKIICLNKHLPQDEKVCALAHELGHVINRGKHSVVYELADEARNVVGNSPDCQIYISYQHTGIDKKVRKSVYELIYLDEVKAWESAEELLKFLKVKMPKKFKFYKKAALATYKNQWTKSLDYTEIIDLDRPDF